MTRADNALAAGAPTMLTALGIAKGDRVALLMPNAASTIACSMAR